MHIMSYLINKLLINKLNNASFGYLNILFQKIPNEEIC